jgi:hypothetical protein
MPRLSRWFLVSAMCYLLTGSAAGAALMLSRANAIHAPAWLLPMHIEFMLTGWSVQLAMGIAYWILPRHKVEPARGSPALAWGSFAILNLGVLQAALAGSIRPWPGAILGHAAEAAGVLLFATGIWQRLPRSISLTGRSLPIIG